MHFIYFTVFLIICYSIHKENLPNKQKKTLAYNQSCVNCDKSICLWTFVLLYHHALHPLTDISDQIDSGSSKQKKKEAPLIDTNAKRQLLTVGLSFHVLEVRDVKVTLNPDLKFY